MWKAPRPDKALLDAERSNVRSNPDTHCGKVGDTVYSTEPLRGR